MIDPIFTLTNVVHNCREIFLLKKSQHAERGRRVSQCEFPIDLYLVTTILAMKSRLVGYKF